MLGTEKAPTSVVNRKRANAGFGGKSREISTGADFRSLISLAIMPRPLRKIEIDVASGLEDGRLEDRDWRFPAPKRVLRRP